GFTFLDGLGRSSAATLSMSFVCGCSDFLAVAAVEHPELHRFGDVWAANARRPVEIGDGAGQPEHLGVGAGGEAEAIDRRADEAGACVVGRRYPLELPR